eukprot:9403673-Lingulodinium_polyedra.AAC.1
MPNSHLRRGPQPAGRRVLLCVGVVHPPIAAQRGRFWNEFVVAFAKRSAGMAARRRGGPRRVA